MSTSNLNLPAELSIPTRLTDLVTQIQQECLQRFGADAALIWFGSWVKGSAREQSDIDLALDSPHAISNIEFAALRDWIDDLPTLYSIDMVNMAEISERLRNEIKHTGIRL